jgi:hypothetical protein
MGFHINKEVVIVLFFATILSLHAFPAEQKEQDGKSFFVVLLPVNFGR